MRNPVRGTSSLTYQHEARGLCAEADGLGDLSGGADGAAAREEPLDEVAGYENAGHVEHPGNDVENGGGGLKGKGG